METKEMTEVIYKNYVGVLDGEAISESVDHQQIKNLIEVFHGQGINVVTVSLPEFVMDDREYKVKTYKIDEDHPFELESNVDTIFLYQWFKYPIMGFEVIRFATKSKEL